DRVEGVEVRDAARIGDGDEPVELPEVLDRECDPLLVREAPEDLGGDRAAQVRVQLGQALHRRILRVGSGGLARSRALHEVQLPSLSWRGWSATSSPWAARFPATIRRSTTSSSA